MYSTCVDLRTRTRPALELAVPRPRVGDRPVERQAAVVQDGRTGAERFRGLEAVRDEAEGHTGTAEGADPRLALLLETFVAHREDLVGDEDVRLAVLRRREPE